MDFLTRMYTVRKNVCQMLEDRGFLVGEVSSVGTTQPPERIISVAPIVPCLITWLDLMQENMACYLSGVV